MNKENKLGMGLGALLSTSNNKNENINGIQKINISQIIQQKRVLKKLIFHKLYQTHHSQEKNSKSLSLMNLQSLSRNKD